MWLNAIITLTVYGHGAFSTNVLGFVCAGAGLLRMAVEVAMSKKGMQGQVDIEGQVEDGSGPVQKVGEQVENSQGQVQWQQRSSLGTAKGQAYVGWGWGVDNQNTITILALVC